MAAGAGGQSRDALCTRSVWVFVEGTAFEGDGHKATQFPPGACTLCPAALLPATRHAATAAAARAAAAACRRRRLPREHAVAACMRARRVQPSNTENNQVT